MTTDFDARPIASLTFPGVGALLDEPAVEKRGHGRRRALLLQGAELEAHDLDALLAGEGAPESVFPLPWPGWEHGFHSVSPDGTFAAFSGQRSVRAVNADGTTRWVYEHGCWDQRVGHPHTGDELQICPGYEHGSCRVSDDGRFVWAHVVLTAGEEPQDYLEGWVVLDAEDGRELARHALEESVASGSCHLSHPDGVHMGLDIGMGQDGVLVYWGRWDGERLTVHDELNKDLDRILFDVHPDHPGFLTVEHYADDIRLHALDGTVLAETDALHWDHACGFLDGATVLATSGIEYEEDPEEYGTWLLDARTLEIRGRVRYPEGRTDSQVLPLGDGTWLTYDRAAGTVHRWEI
ncbi:hypothetical protein ABZ135_20835 [Streptomyces sp. NPDC006339]|uniref:hypothetical protein n=1 Tax=Streptomyces sp. NPDC006339 TaxID=3156755 RepID=UPI0033A620DB